MAKLPADVVRIVSTVATFLGVTDADLFVADHNHEGLSEGAYSIAYEGDFEWSMRFSEALHERKVSVPSGWYIECGAGWRLHLYPKK